MLNLAENANALLATMAASMGTPAPMPRPKSVLDRVDEARTLRDDIEDRYRRLDQDRRLDEDDVSELYGAADELVGAAKSIMADIEML